MAGRSTVPTPIIDKNGKATTVHKSTGGDASVGRIGSLTISRPSVSGTTPFKDRIAAQRFVQSLSEDAPILESRVSDWHDTLRPDDEVESTPDTPWRERARKLATTELWLDVSDAIGSKIDDMSPTSNERFHLAAQFVEANRNTSFGKGNSMSAALDDFLELN